MESQRLQFFPKAHHRKIASENITSTIANNCGIANKGINVIKQFMVVNHHIIDGSKWAVLVKSNEVLLVNE